MTKKYFKTSFIYALIGIFLGAFYREFTRIIGFYKPTNLGLAHTHTLVLGLILFLILTLFAKVFDMEEDKKEKKFFITYNLGLILTVLTIGARGFYQIKGLENPALSASISGLAGIGHISLSFAFYFLYTYLKSCINKS
uniref:DUF2871 family protein n=1 Tax=Anaerococcus mediterraneensis TaxID=1870984 RepID=UPI000930F90F|nr:DUF2871 family protein [Anaerococcus mediterraneensis]